MAALPPSAPLTNAAVNTFIPEGCPALAANEIPTVANVISEWDRCRGIKRARDTRGDWAVTDEELVISKTRKYRVISKHADQEGAPAWAAALLHQTVQIDQRLTAMEQRLTAMEQRTHSCLTGIYNFSRISHPDLVLRPMNKSIPGHPAIEFPLHFHFEEAAYEIGAPPPHGLVPLTNFDICAIHAHAPYNAIYWFYNDVRVHPDLDINQRRFGLTQMLTI